VRHEQASESRRTSLLPRRVVLGTQARIASTRRSRLLGLAGLGRLEAPDALLLPHCRSVHTFGMRFALDVVFLDDDLRELARRSRVSPQRLVFCRAARNVLEVPAT